SGGGGQVRVGGAAVRDGEVAGVEEGVDEETESQFSRKPAGRSMGGVNEPELFQVRHHVPDGGRRQGNWQQARQISRTNRLAGRQITLDNLPKNLARPLVQRCETNLCRSNGNMV